MPVELCTPVKSSPLSPSSCPEPIKPSDRRAIRSPSRRRTSGPSRAHLAVGQSQACRAHPKTKPSCPSGAHQAVVSGNPEPVDIEPSGNPEPVKLSGPSQAHLAVGPSEPVKRLGPFRARHAAGPSQELSRHCWKWELHCCHWECVSCCHHHCHCLNHCREGEGQIRHHLD
jgi:hypothetical protein